jgi:hypothetical protein
MGYENYRQADNEARYLEGRETLIIEQAAIIAQQRADIEALVAAAEADWELRQCVSGCANRLANYEQAHKAIQPIIERYREVG